VPVRRSKRGYVAVFNKEGLPVEKWGGGFGKTPLGKKAAHQKGILSKTKRKGEGKNLSKYRRITSNLRKTESRLRAHRMKISAREKNWEAKLENKYVKVLGETVWKKEGSEKREKMTGEQKFISEKTRLRSAQ